MTLGSSEDVSFTVELDRTALSRTGVRIRKGEAKGATDSTITMIIPLYVEPPLLVGEEILMVRFILLFHGLPWHDIPPSRR
jgi:hypothetical protein